MGAASGMPAPFVMQEGFGLRPKCFMIPVRDIRRRREQRVRAPLVRFDLETLPI
jgi:hypothetical protein